MNYKVMVVSWIRASLQELPPAVRAQVYQKLLVDLPADPDKYLTSAVVPYPTLFSFPVVAKDESHPYEWWFVFFVDRGTPGELHVESFRVDDQSESN